MNHQAYFKYLRKLMSDIWIEWPGGSTDLRGIIFKLTASPYHFWLENQAVIRPRETCAELFPADIAQSSPKASAEKGDELMPNVRGPSASSLTSPSNADAKESSVENGTKLKSDNLRSVPSSAEDSSNLANKAQEIRSFIRANINDKEYKHMTKSALHALEMLLREGKWAMVSEASDGALIAWYENWVLAVKS